MQRRTWGTSRWAPTNTKASRPDEVSGREFSAEYSAYLSRVPPQILADGKSTGKALGYVEQELAGDIIRPY